MMYYKSCPRYDGDRTLEHDFDRYYLLCLQCGNVQYPSVEQKRTTKRSIFTQTPAERAMVPSPKRSSADSARALHFRRHSRVSIV